MSEKLKLQDGEASLEAKVFESDTINGVILRAGRMGLAITALRIDRVTKDGPFKSTDESTVVAPVIYLWAAEQPRYLITRRSQEEKYALFRYHWVP